MIPASATRPDAVIKALVDATWPLLMPIDTLAPPPQTLLVEAIWTFHSPSNVAAAAGVATDIAANKSMRAMITLRNCPMTFPSCWTPAGSHKASPENVMGVTPAVATAFLVWTLVDRRSTRGAARSTQKAPPERRGLCADVVGCRSLVDPAPGLATAEHAAEVAAPNTQGIRAFQRDGRIIGAAGIGVEDPAAPFGIVGRLHVDQNLLAVLVRFLVHRIAAEIGAALLDPDLAFLLLGQPHAERRIGRLNRRSGRLGRRRRGRDDLGRRRPGGRGGHGGGDGVLLRGRRAGRRLCRSRVIRGRDGGRGIRRIGRSIGRRGGGVGRCRFRGRRLRIPLRLLRRLVLVVLVAMRAF